MQRVFKDINAERTVVRKLMNLQQKELALAYAA